MKISGRTSVRSAIFIILLLFSTKQGSYTLAAEKKSAPAPADLPPIETGGLPPRTVVQPPPLRPVPGWLRTHLRIGHLPGYHDRMVKEFLRAGYNVVTVNALARWDRVGPSASLYPPEEVKAADEYLRRTVDTIHS